MKNLRQDVLKVADIVFSRGKERVVRSIPVPLQDATVPIMRGVLCLNRIKGKDIMDFVDIYTIAENSHGTRFFLPDEKEVIHKFIEDCTSITEWRSTI